MVERDPYVLVLNACRWIRADKDRWWRLVELCEWYAATHPNSRMRRGDVFNSAEQRGMSVTLCRQFRFDNSLWSVLSRYAIMCRPDLARTLRPRRCGIDSVHLRSVWVLMVGDPSCLAIDDWSDAT